MIFDDEQEYIINEFIKFMNDPYEQVFQYSGGPGTGKTTLLFEMMKRIGIDLNRVAFMAYIGQAAINMKSKGLSTAGTIHSWIYKVVNTYKTDKYGNVIYSNKLNRPIMTHGFVPRESLDNIDLIVIDEAGSVPMSLKHDIEKYGIKIVATGDLDQLPPVCDVPAYLYSGKVYRLNNIKRQKAGSNIVNLSRRLLKGEKIHNGYYGDVLVIDYDELTDDMIMCSDVIICGKNKTRDIINNRVRHDILHIDSNLPLYGEKIICRKNNRFIQSDGINLANGLSGYVVSNPNQSTFNGKTFKVDFNPINSNIVFKNIDCDYKYFISDNNLRQIIKDDKYSIGEKFEFGYAITCHLSQGSQYKRGIYIEEYLDKSIQNNLNYTGITRFSDMCIYVKKRNKYF